MHERHVSKSHNGNQSSSTQNGVRQRAPQQCARGGDSNITPTATINVVRDNCLQGLPLPPPPLTSGAPPSRLQNSFTSIKILDALALPAQAAAAAAAAGHQPPRGGQKRKSVSLLFLTLICGAVVYYSGTMYNYDDYFADAKNARRPRLRSSRSSSLAMGMDYQFPATISRMMQPPPPAAGSGLTHRQLLVRDRIVNAIKAAFVADAASMGTHWIYNVNELEMQLQSKDQPEFRSPPVPRFYSAQEFPGHYGPGQPSPYGEQLLFVTNFAVSVATVSKSLGEFDDDDEHNKEPDSILQSMSAAMQKWASSFGGRADHATLQFLSCRNKQAQDGALEQQLKQQENDDDGDSGEDETKLLCGADDDQAHFFLKVIPMTCLYVGHPHRRHYVEQAIRVHQHNNNAVLLGLALSDLLERVLLMDDNSGSGNETAPNSESEERTKAFPKPATSLRDALDTTLTLLQEDHSLAEGWFRFESWTKRHHQQEALLDSWLKAKKTAEKKKSIAEVASASGSSCHMPGALIVTLHTLYRAANAESKTPTANPTNPTIPKKKPSAATHYSMGYNYFVKALLGVQTGATVAPREENPLLVAAVRGNILAAGDTCSRAILMGAILGAAYGEPPTAWWDQLYPVLSAQVEEAAYTIADFAVKRLGHRRHRKP